VLPTFFVMVILFAAGVVFCYFLILPFSFAWLVQQGGGAIQYIPRADTTIQVIEFFVLAFGLAFETPVVVFYLVFFGIVPYAKLRKSWRTVYLVIIVLACGITPDWSWVTMTSLAVAMVVLYEGCMLLCRLVLGARIKAQGEKAALEAAEAAAESA
jgi:sec-independent protein translocase protein TatC